MAFPPKVFLCLVFLRANLQGKETGVEEERGEGIMKEIQKGKGTRGGTWKLVVLLISTQLVSLCLTDHQVVVVEDNSGHSNRYEDGRKKMSGGESVRDPSGPDVEGRHFKAGVWPSSHPLLPWHLGRLPGARWSSGQCFAGFSPSPVFG